MPEIRWDCHDSRSGYHQNGVLHFNPTLLAQNPTDYINITVTHEMAHYVQKIVYPQSLERRIVCRGSRLVRSRRKVHGQEWKFIMRLFGISNPTLYHEYNVENVPKRRVFKRVPVYCNCSVYQVTNKIISNLKSGHTYTCKFCKSKVSLTKPLTSTEVPVS